MLSTIRSLGVLVSFLSVAMVVLAGTASATVAHRGEATSIGGAGSAPANPYPLGGPSDVAVGPALGPVGGDVYVTDPAHFRVEEFSPAGDLILMFGKGVDKTTGANICVVLSGDECGAGAQGEAGAGEFDVPRFIAVDRSFGLTSGDVYVGDTGTNTVYKFTSQGEFLEENRGSGAPSGPFSTLAGVAVDGLGDLWVFTGISKMYEFDSEGALLQEWGTGGVRQAGIAVDGEASLYLVEGFGQLEKVSSTGEVISKPLEEGVGTPTGVATGVGIGNVYVDLGTEVLHVVGTEIAERFGKNELTGAGGVGVDDSDEVVYVANPAGGIVSRFSPSISTETGPAEEETADEATLTGEVSPHGAEVTECVFEIGTTPSYERDVPCEGVVGSGEGSVHVKARVTGLDGGTAYHFRLHAGNQETDVRGQDREFTTLPVAKIEHPSVQALTARTAELTAKIDPVGLQTHYRFEWGVTDHYGSVGPARELTATSSATIVSQTIAELQPNTTYHWRVVAEDVNGIVTGADHRFVYKLEDALLPDGRAYEMVSPSEKNEALLSAFFIEATPPQISEDGKRLYAASIQCFAGAESCTASRSKEGQLYEFSRDSNGWRTTPRAPSAAALDNNALWGVDANTGQALLVAPRPPNGEDHFFAQSEDGALKDIGPIGLPAEGAGPFGPGVLREVLAANGDLSHLVYATTGPVWPFDETEPVQATLYEYQGFNNSAPSSVAITGPRGGTDLIDVCGVTLGGLQGTSASVYGSVAESGTTYFSAVACGSGGSGVNVGKAIPAVSLYARIDNTHTVKVSESTPEVCTTMACKGSTPSDANFQGASSDGTRSFFTSVQQLTDGGSENAFPGDSATRGCGSTHPETTGCNLYESECIGSCEGAGERKLYDLSEGDQGEGPRVQGVMAISPSGSDVYFVARGVLTTVANAQGATAREGAENLYVYVKGETGASLRFVASLAEVDQEQWASGIGYANVTPDGRYLVFTSHRELLSDTRSEGPSQVYRYDADDGELMRVSVGQQGFGDDGEGNIGDASIVLAQQSIVPLGQIGFARSDPTMSHDGAFVFFESPASLAPGALDDVKTGSEGPLAQNIYEWHNGEVSLISDGRDVNEHTQQLPSAVELLGTDASGANVFFATTESLVQQDRNTGEDYYDARICTGSERCPATTDEPGAPVCVEGCQANASRTGTVASPASITFEGPGNLPVPMVKPAAKPKAKVLTRAQRLAKALKACKRDKSKKKRSSCEKSAHKKFGRGK